LPCKSIPERSDLAIEQNRRGVRRGDNAATRSRTRVASIPVECIGGSQLDAFAFDVPFARGL
jgi:hypothetical protein